MALTIHKETVQLSDISNDKIHLKLPAFSEILTVAEQFKGSSTVQVWYRCNPNVEKVDRFVHVIGTGHPVLPKVLATYLSTVILNQGALVLHFFADRGA